ncbi:trigger factor [Patescibacteria group bacterium]|nr:trigger factor [Patescibacteria group bacterium]MBU0879775.1 trigger factor [Patescibacteria group bacterium]MBU0880338.1 trigger factor [Patescibacteria group bacterium]MBU0897811.1 trigger factor [Patescibacteria group bacterium]MBU1062618.1 trigger factor [Patescibacteria group bacterium]
MNIQKKDLGKSQVELTVELSVEEFQQYINRGVIKISQEVKIEGFRPGKASYEILKSKVGEMAILEEAARIAINKTIDQAIKGQITEQLVGQPQIDITKLAPNNPLEYKAVITILPDVELGDYKNAKVELAKSKVEDEEVKKIINHLQETRCVEKISEEVIKLGDKVIVNIEMFIDKVPVEGGQGKGTAVIIGKDYVVPGFGNKLIGAQRNDVREFSLPYPNDFYQAHLAGKLVDFRAKVEEIYQRELPEVDGEFAKTFGLSSVFELEENIKKSILVEKEQEEEQKTEKIMMEKIISQAKFGDLPELLINHEAEVMMSELEYGVTSQGGKFDDYLSHLKKTKNQLMLEILPDAIKRVKVSLVIRAIAHKEKIIATDKEIEVEVEKLLKQYGTKDDIRERINSQAYKDYLVNNLAGKKVIEKLKEWNIQD